MVSKVRFRSFKTIDLQARRPYTSLILIALGIAAVVTHPQAVLVIMAYLYLASPFIGMAIARIRRRSPESSESRQPIAEHPQNP
jgi:phosphatidylserine synthase